LGVLFVAFVAWAKTRKPALLAMATWPLANLTTDVLKVAWKWNRPSWPDVLQAHSDFHVRGAAATGYGTASAHSANMIAGGLCFLGLCPPVGVAWLVFAVLTGLSRIYVGVHWPSEVLLGWVVGAIVATIVVKTWEAAARLWARRHEAPVESPAGDQ